MPVAPVITSRHEAQENRGDSPDFSYFESVATVSCMPVCNRCKKHSNCLTIDPCEHCGEKDWDEATVLRFSGILGEHGSRYAQDSGTSKIRKGCGCVLGVGVFLAILAGLHSFFISDNEQLANKYSVSVERVSAPPKPHGCAYNDAPLGDKHCHYDRQVYVYDKKGQVIEINGKPQTCPSGCGPAYSVEQVFVKVED
jgi:hypothetical protein